MSTKIASLHAEIGAETQGFVSGARGVKKELTEQEKRFKVFSDEQSKRAKSYIAYEKQKEQALKQTALAEKRAAAETALAEKRAAAETALAEKRAAAETARAARDSERARKQSLDEFKNGAVVAIAAVAAVGTALKSAYDDYQALAGQVRDVAQLTGTSAEESSRLIQVLDDFGVTADDVTVAARAMKEKGLSPTIETLAQLSDQFLAIEDPAKRLEFAQDHLGKSAAKYYNVLQQGGDVIRQNASEISKSLILTDVQIRKAEEQRLAIDALGDTYMGAKVAVGAWVGELVLANKRLQDQAEMETRAWEAGQKLVDTYYEGERTGLAYEEEVWRVGLALEKGALMTEFYNAQLAAQGQIVEADAEALQELSDQNVALLHTMTDFQGIADAYNEKQADLKQQNQELLVEKQKLLDEGYGQEHEKITDINTKLDENIAKQHEAAAAAEEAVKQRIVAMVQESLMADQKLSGDELNALLTLQERWGLMSTEAVASTKEVFGAVDQYLKTGDIDAFTASVDGATNALLGLPSEKIVILDIQTQINGQPASLEQLYELNNNL